MVHIPPIRFFAHLLLSIPPVCYVYLVLADYYRNTVETTYATVSRLAAVYHPASPYYIVTVACLLPCLGHLYTLIAGSATSLFQHSIVHLTICFWVLSEIEFYRAYIKFNKLHWRSAFPALLRANLDEQFQRWRDPLGYAWETPRDAKLLVDDEKEHKSFSVMKVLGPSPVPRVALCVLFFVVQGCICYPVKRIVNPDAAGESFIWLMAGWDVLFRMDTALKTLLGLLLLRVVRQANVVLFYGVVRGVRKICRW